MMSESAMPAVARHTYLLEEAYHNAMSEAGSYSAATPHEQQP